MQIIAGDRSAPIIYTAHHASHDFHELSERCALSEDEKIRFSDYGTAETVPQNGIATIIAKHSRALGDLNRNPNDPGRFQDQDYAKPLRHRIWKQGKELSEAEKNELHARFYKPFHDEIVTQLRAADKPVLVVAWDNTAHYVIGKNKANEDVTMPSFVLSNRGGEETAEADDEPTSCSPELLTTLKYYFERELTQRNLPSDIHLNLVYRGGYITRHYSSRRNATLLRDHGISHPVQSLQVEYNTSITHDQETLAPKQTAINDLREAFEVALAETLVAVPLN